MSFEDQIDAVDQACRDTFGSALGFVVQNQGGDPVPFVGIIDTGLRKEESQPGAGSSYARLSARLADFPQPPAKGDFIVDDENYYVIVDFYVDAAGLMTAVLKFHHSR